MIDQELFEKIKSILEEADKRIKPKTVNLTLKRLSKFCKIIEEKNPIYIDLNEARNKGYEGIPIPESFLLTFISPITHDFFTTGIGRHMGKEIKGIIHTSSKIEYKKQLYCETPYKLEMALLNVTQKKGKMGEFIDGMYLISLKNQENEVCFTDYHEFFMKVN